MNYFKLIVVGIVSIVFFVGDIHVSEAKGKSRKFAAEAASAEGPSLALPIFSYNPDGSAVLSENGQQFVEVNYRYGKDGKLLGAAGKGSFKIEDGFGGINSGMITQDYRIIDGQAKLTKNDTLLNTKRPEGSHSKQNITVQYRYDNNGKLQSAVGGGKLTGDDGFGNTTKSNIEQTFTITGGQAKFKDSKIDSKTKNTDGSGKNQDLTVTYQYDAKGKLKNCSGAGTFKKDDGFGNVTTGNVSQTYKVVNGQPKLVASREIKKEEITPAAGKSRRFVADPAGARGRRYVEDPASVLISPTPPPPPSKEQQKQADRKGTLKPQPIEKGIGVAPLPPPPQEEETAWRRSPAEPEPEAPSAEGQPCAANIPRYQQKGCVEAEQPQEEATQPQQCERGTWSPTLKTCVE